MIQAQTPEQEAVHREMARVAQDDCMIFNPTDTDFYIEWDGYKHLVPNKYKDIGFGNGQREVKRYMAIWYCNHMKDQLINERGEKEANELIHKRRGQGKEEFRDKYVENKEVWDKVSKTNDPQLLAEIMPGLFLGVTREFGTDLPTVSEGQKIDTETAAEKMIKELSTKRYQSPGRYDASIAPDPEPEVSPEAVQSPTKPSKKKLVSEVTADE